MRVRNFTILTILLVVFIHSTSAQELNLPAWMSDNMMLPTGISFTIKGKAEPGKQVSVCFESISKTTQSDENGTWNVVFPILKAGVNGDLSVACGKQKKLLRNVTTGDTWLCAGQSNMQRRVALSAEAEEAVESVSSIDIRYFDGAKWTRVTSENVKSLSAVAIFFAIEMAQRQKAPVGIYVAARGGTSIDAWLPGEAFPNTAEGRMKRSLIGDSEVLKAAEEDKKDFRPVGEYRLARWGLSRAVPASHYEELIKPYGDLPVRGVIWYQGESNAGSVKQAREYRYWLKNLISEYRKLWGNKTLPFVIIQLPAYDPGTTELRKAWAALQDSQARVARRTKNAELVDIKDLGDIKDIHPARKKEVGERAAEVGWGLVGE